MDKEQLLQELRRHAQTGDITESELQSVFYGTRERISPVHKKGFSINVINVLYGIGGLIVFAGLVALIVQNWSEFPTTARILITLGMAIVLFISSVLFTSKGYSVLAQILFAVSYVFFPLGIGVSLYEFEVDTGIGGISFILLCLTLLAAISYLILKRLAVNVLFAVIFGTSTAYAFLTYALSNSVHIDGEILGCSSSCCYFGRYLGCTGNICDHYSILAERVCAQQRYACAGFYIPDYIPVQNNG